MRSIGCIAVLLLVCSPSAWSAEALPVLSGRWSSGRCIAHNPLETRTFTPGATSTDHETCALRISRQDGRIYYVHLACQYTDAKSAEDDAVIEVISRSSMTWINQCQTIPYRFCG